MRVPTPRALSQTSGETASSVSDLPGSVPRLSPRAPSGGRAEVLVEELHEFLHADVCCVCHAVSVPGWGPVYTDVCVTDVLFLGVQPWAALRLNGCAMGINSGDT